jgi:hypothetical protein
MSARNAARVFNNIAEISRKRSNSRKAILSPADTVRYHTAERADIEAARQLAKVKGMPSQTYIRRLLHEALVREAKLFLCGGARPEWHATLGRY